MENTKSKVAAGLLGIFLGQFGVHNFYLGYTKKALIQCIVSVACWVLYAICMILGVLTAAFGIGLIFFLIAIVLCAGPGGMTIWGLVEAIMIFAGKITEDGKGNAIV